MGKSALLIPILILLIYIAGCIKESEKPEEEYQGTIDDHASFSLYISNQAIDRTYDPVDMDVFIDNELVISDLFYVENFHNWIRYDLNVSFGNHTIIVSSEIGKYAIEDELFIEMKLWAIIDFWGYDSNFNPITFETMLLQPGFA